MTAAKGDTSIELEHQYRAVDFSAIIEDAPAVIILQRVNGGTVEVSCVRRSEDGELGFRIAGEYNSGIFYVDLDGELHPELTTGQFVLLNSCAPSNTSIVLYSGGRGKGIAEIICVANNAGLGFVSEFEGICSFELMSSEASQKNANRKIPIENLGAVVIVKTNTQENSSNCIFDFPETGAHQYFPTVEVYMAEIGLNQKKEYCSDSLMRGHFYEAKNLLGGEPAVALVHGLVKENTTQKRFFGPSRLLLTLVSKSTSTFEILCINKTCVAKTPLTDSDVCKILECDESKVREIVHKGEAAFTIFMNAPKFNNDNTRQTSRFTDANGAPFIDPASEVKLKVAPKIPSAKNKGESDARGPISRHRLSGSARKDDPQKLRPASVPTWNTLAEGIFDNEESAIFVPNALKKPVSRPEMGRASYSEVRDSSAPESKLMSPESVARCVQGAVSATESKIYQNMLARSDVEAQRASVLHSQMLSAAEISSSTQRNFFHDMMDRQQGEECRRRANEAFYKFEAPTPIQAGMFSQIMGLNNLGIPRSLSAPDSQTSRYSTSASPLAIEATHAARDGGPYLGLFFY